MKKIPFQSSRWLQGFRFSGFHPVMSWRHYIWLDNLELLRVTTWKHYPSFGGLQSWQQWKGTEKKCMFSKLFLRSKKKKVFSSSFLYCRLSSTNCWEILYLVQRCSFYPVLLLIQYCNDVIVIGSGDIDPSVEDHQSGCGLVLVLVPCLCSV